MKNIYIYIFLAYNYFNRRFDCLLCWLYFFLFFFLKKNRRTHLNKQLIYGEWILLKKSLVVILSWKRILVPFLFIKFLIDFYIILYHLKIIIYIEL